MGDLPVQHQHRQTLVVLAIAHLDGQISPAARHACIPQEPRGIGDMVVRPDGNGGLCRDVAGQQSFVR